MKVEIKRINKYVFLAFILSLIISGTQEFVSVRAANISLTTYQIKGVKIVLIGMVFYIYSYFTKKRWSTLLANLMCVFGYSYTFFTVFQSTAALESGAREFVSYGLGLYMYILSCFLFLLSGILLVKNYFDSPKKEDYEQLLEIPNEPHYIISNYVYGLEKSGDLYNKLTVISFLDSSKEIQIDINTNDFKSLKIPLNNITDIQIKSGLILKEQRPEVENNEIANQLLLTALVGTWGPLIAQSKIFQGIEAYNKTRIETGFEIEFYYTEDSQNKKLLFQTKKDPSSFVDYIKLQKTVN